MHIAQECLNTDDLDATCESQSPESSKSASNNNNLLGLEAFASTIDSILSRIKINLEQIQIRVENLDHGTTSSYQEMNEQFMSSSTIFNQKPSNGVALELRIKSIKYFDLDSINSAANSLDQQSLGQSQVRITSNYFIIHIEFE